MKNTPPHPLDKIELRNLRIVTKIGVLAHEQKILQPIEIDVILYADLSVPCQTDLLKDTVNYGTVCTLIEEITRENDCSLLEKLAEMIADALLTLDKVEATEITIRKLRPPVPSDLSWTAVSIYRKRAQPLLSHAPPLHRALIALGSNLGDCASYLRLALRHLGTVVAQSQVYETKPVGGPAEQGSFLNMVIAIETPLDPFALLKLSHRIEDQAGRERQEVHGPRTLDIDILYFEDIKIESPELMIPHPRIQERAFVLAPLAEIAPEKISSDKHVSVASQDIRPLGYLDNLD